MNKIVLMYHDIIKDAGQSSGFQNESALSYKVVANEFEKQVQLIADYIREGKLSNDYVEFTFDDGGVSFYSEAAPILERYGFKGTFFIATKYIGTDFFLTENQVKELNDRGHIIASHSHTHPDNMISLTYQEMCDEWRISKNILEDIIRKPVTIASIPNGYKSTDVEKSACSTGLTTLYTSEPTTKRVDQNGFVTIGRYVVLRSTSLEEIKKIVTNSCFRRRQMAKYCALKVAHFILGKNYNKVKVLLTGKKNNYKDK